MIRTLAALVLSSVLLLAQTETGRITGIVRDATTGTAMSNATVHFNRNLRTGTEVQTDTQGRYSIPTVAPGQHRVTAEAPKANPGVDATLSKLVNVAAGQELELNFALELPGQISGRIVDQNREPMSGMSVILIAREYSSGALRYVFSSMARTDDEGRYVMPGVKPGRAFLLMAQKRVFRLEAISDAPADPKFRKPAYAATFYPGVPNLEAAQALSLKAGEQREGVDLRMQRTPSYCVEGVLQGAGGTDGMMFTISDRQPTSGASGDGAVFIVSPRGKTGPDGKVRICNLYPGDYEVTAFSGEQSLPKFYGSAYVTVADRDVRNFTLTARPVIEVSGEVVWEGEAPDPPLTDKLAVSLRPLTRAPWTGERTDVKSGIPGVFTLPSVLSDSHAVNLSAIPKNVYVKAVTYAGQDLRMEPLRVGSGIGNTSMRVALARDGAIVAATVADKEGKAASDARVLVLPISVASEAALAAAMISGQCDQNGAWTSNAIAPGKYYVLALSRPADKSPESIAKLWGMRTHFKEVELTPKSSAQVTLAPMSLD